MLRALLIATLLAGCGGHARGPAWPEPSPKETDGGESLEPRRISPLATSDVASEDDPTPAPGTDPDKPAVSSDSPDASDDPEPTVTSPDVIINIDDIVIDVDDD